MPSLYNARNIIQGFRNAKQALNQMSSIPVTGKTLLYLVYSQTSNFTLPLFLSLSKNQKCWMFKSLKEVYFRLRQRTKSSVHSKYSHIKGTLICTPFLLKRQNWRCSWIEHLTSTPKALSWIPSTITTTSRIYNPFVSLHSQKKNQAEVIGLALTELDYKTLENSG